MKIKNTCKQKMLGVSPRCYNFVRLLAETDRRTLTAQVELLAESECKRRGIELPAENESVKSSIEATHD